MSPLALSLVLALDLCSLSRKSREVELKKLRVREEEKGGGGLVVEEGGKNGAQLASQTPI